MFLSHFQFMGIYWQHLRGHLQRGLIWTGLTFRWLTDVKPVIV